MNIETALNVIEGYMPSSEFRVIKDYTKHSEEKQFFIEKAKEIADIIKAMPDLYEQDGKGENAIVYLHYFAPSFDTYILEINRNDPSDAFGLTISHDSAVELGYVNINELKKYSVELDLHFVPKTVGEIRQAVK